MTWNWLAIESVATAGSAAFTAVMVAMTWRAIADGRKHHKDEYRPILVLAPVDGVDPARRDTFIKFERSPSDGGAGYFLAGVILKNIGGGPALNCRMTIRFQGIQGYGVTRGLSPVGAGGELDSGGRPLHISVILGPGFNDLDFQVAPAAGWQILLEYEDILGQVFHTVHSSDPRASWTTLGQGLIPRGESAESHARRLAQSISVTRPTSVDAL